MPKTKDRQSRQRVLDLLSSSLRYYSNHDKWNQDRLVRKAVRIAVRLLAVHTVYRKETGQNLLTPSIVDGLSEFVALTGEVDRGDL